MPTRSRVSISSVALTILAAYVSKVIIDYYMDEYDPIEEERKRNIRRLEEERKLSEKNDDKSWMKEKVDDKIVTPPVTNQEPSNDNVSSPNNARPFKTVIEDEL